MYKEYVKCDNCGNLILKGNTVYKYPRYSGLYCSNDCAIQSAGLINELLLDEDVIMDCSAEKIIITTED